MRKISKTKNKIGEGLVSVSKMINETGLVLVIPLRLRKRTGQILYGILVMGGLCLGYVKA
ncbi:MAG TPA: hypothetical protein VGI38_06680 [Puia sp.]